MQLKEIEFSAEQREFLLQCGRMGGVLDICFLSFDEAENDYELSQKNAVEAMKIFSRRYLERFTAYNPDLDVNQYWQIKIDENVEPTGKLIDYKEFLGRGFDFKNNQVNIFNYSKGARSTSVFDGFAHALLDPPYGFRIMPRDWELSVEYGIEEQKRMTEFLFEFLNKILGINDFSDFADYQICSWSDDWSNYFDAGKEWWGCFYWTLLNREKKRITVIAASSTD